jgi:hypothetical protein
METRDTHLKIRITQDEKAALKELSKSQGMTLADFIRHQVGQVKTVDREPKKTGEFRRADPMLLANIGRVGSNLNQIARWANRYKSAAEAAGVITALVAIEQSLLLKVPYRRKPKVDGDAD